MQSTICWASASDESQFWKFLGSPPNVRTKEFQHYRLVILTTKPISCLKCLNFISIFWFDLHGLNFICIIMNLICTQPKTTTAFLKQAKTNWHESIHEALPTLRVGQQRACAKIAIKSLNLLGCCALVAVLWLLPLSLLCTQRILKGISESGWKS